MEKIILTFTFFISFSVAAISQNRDKTHLYTKDGIDWGIKSEMVRVCAEAAKAKYDSAYANNEGFCECILEVIANNYTSKELMKMFDKHPNDWGETIYKESSKQVAAQLEDCGANNFNYNDNLVTRYADFEKEFMISCLNIRSEEKENKLSNIDTIYCNCLADEFVKRGFALNNFKNIIDENSVLFNEVFISCANASLVSILPQKKSDVNSVVKFEDINIIKVGSIYRVKLNIGGLEKYFLIDSGASALQISKDMERELLIEGIIKKSDYVEDGIYELANGVSTKCRTLLLSNIKIGNFLVDNVIVAVANSGNNLLVGKSLLDKFSNWSIDNEKSILHLEIK